jgi:hypothetical protein
MNWYNILFFLIGRSNRKLNTCMQQEGFRVSVKSRWLLA